jgi:predicted metalloprotease with PDZ domain
MFQPITYILRFPAPATHYVEVEATVPTEGREHIELMLAAWTPGSYLVREYARHGRTGGASSVKAHRPSRCDTASMAGR